MGTKEKSVGCRGSGTGPGVLGECPCRKESEDGEAERSKGAKRRK